MPANTSIIPLKAIRTGDQSTGDVVALGEFEAGDKISSNYFSLSFADISATGNATFDTSTLFVDGTNNRVGVGTTTPKSQLQVVGPASGNGEIYLTDGDSTGLSDSLLIRKAGSEAYIYNRSAGSLNIGRGDTTTRLRIDSIGRVGVGYIGPDYDLDVRKNTSATDVVTRIQNADTDAASDTLLRLQVGGTTQSCYIQFGDSDDTDAGYIRYVHSDNSMRFITNAIDNFRMEADGDFHANGDIVAYSTTVSDLRLKEDVQNISDALVKIDQINGVTFVRKNGGEKSAGVIAQEVIEVLPEAVKEKELPLQAGDGEKYYVVEYDAVTGLLVQALKELNAKVKQLEETIINKS